jgi:hypothetical protein
VVLLDVPCAAQVPVDPRGEAVAVARDLVPVDVERVVPVVVAVRVRRMRAAGSERDRVDHPARDDNRACARLELLDDLFDGHERARRREHDLLLYARDPPKLDVAGAVGVLRVHDPDVGMVRGNGRELLACKRARDRREWCPLHEVGADVAPQHTERQVRRAGRIRCRHACV